MVENTPTFASLETIMRIHDALGWLTMRGGGFYSDLVAASYVSEQLTSLVPPLDGQPTVSYSLIASQDPASCPVPGYSNIESCSAFVLKAEGQYARGVSSRYNLYLDPQEFGDKHTHILNRTIQWPAGRRPAKGTPRGAQPVPQTEADALLEFLVLEHPNIVR